MPLRSVRLLAALLLLSYLYHLGVPGVGAQLLIDRVITFQPVGSVAHFVATATSASGSVVYVAALTSTLSLSDSLTASNAAGWWPTNSNTTHGILYAFDGATFTLRSSYVLATNSGTAKDIYHSLIVAPAAAGQPAGQDVIYVTGGTAGAWDDSTSPSPANAGGLDVFVAKFTCDTATYALTKVWVRQIGSSGDDSGIDIAADTDSSNVFVVGRAAGTVASAANPNAGGLDMFLLKYSAAGVLQYATMLADNAAERPNSAADELAVKVGSFAILKRSAAVSEYGFDLLVRHNWSLRAPRHGCCHAGSW